MLCPECLIPQLIAKQWGVGRIKPAVKTESAPICSLQFNLGILNQTFAQWF